MPTYLNDGRQPIPAGARKQRQDRLALESEQVLASSRWADRFQGMAYLRETIGSSRPIKDEKEVPLAPWDDQALGQPPPPTSVYIFLLYIECAENVDDPPIKWTSQRSALVFFW